VDAETLIPAHLEAFLGRSETLRDDDRLALADARRRGSEVVKAAARQAALDMLPERAGAYVACWAHIATAFVPERLEQLLRAGSGNNAAEIAEWQEVARLVRLALDEALLALLLSDTITPPDVRELYDPWRRMLEAAHEPAPEGF
jgi:hypothetical protein